MLGATTTEITWISILVLLIPVVAVGVKYLLNLSKTQQLFQKTGHQGLLNSLAATAIDAAEKWALVQQKEAGVRPSGADKKAMAVDFLIKQGKSHGIPEVLLNEQMISGVIEALLVSKSSK
jgi:hypothetical protein